MSHAKLPAHILGLLSSLLLTMPLCAQLLVIDPDAPGISNGDDISSAFAGQGVALSSLGGAGDGKVYAVESLFAPTGTLVFGWGAGGFTDAHWGRPSSPAFGASFSGFLANTVSIAYTTDGSAVLEAFGTSGSLGTTMPGGGVGTLTFDAGSDAIEYIEVSFAGASDFGLLDNLVVGTSVPEPGATGILTGLGLVGFAVWRMRR